MAKRLFTNFILPNLGADSSIRDHSGKLAEQYLQPKMIDLNGIDVQNRSNLIALSSGSLCKLNILHGDVNQNSYFPISNNILRSSTQSLHFNQAHKARTNFLRRLPKRYKSLF